MNVTAGMDLSIGEFQEVGQIVKQFASEDATVVVGTVIDPELSNTGARDGGGDRSRPSGCGSVRSRHAQREHATGAATAHARDR